MYLHHDGKRIRLHPVDPVFNATSGRARRAPIKDEPARSPEKSASCLSFDQEYGSILSHDGGFKDDEEDDDQ